MAGDPSWVWRISGSSVRLPAKLTIGSVMVQRSLAALEDARAEALAGLARTQRGPAVVPIGKVLVGEAIGGAGGGLEPSCPWGPTLLRRGCLPIPALRR